MRRFSLLNLAALPTLTALLLGCGSPLSLAVHELETGRPDEADVRFRALEAEFSEFDGPERLRYALYRGLTHLALGDVREAERWIDFAKRAADRDVRAFSNAERGRLLAAWRTMGRMPGEERPVQRMR
jgi:hypothetical protein